MTVIRPGRRLEQAEAIRRSDSGLRLPAAGIERATPQGACFQRENRSNELARGENTSNRIMNKQKKARVIDHYEKQLRIVRGLCLRLPEIAKSIINFDTVISTHSNS